MKTLVILNDAPYGSERTYNGLRLAGSVARKGVDLRMFLIGDAVGVCGTCIDARGIAEGELPEGARRSTLDELTDWPLEADKVLVF